MMHFPAAALYGMSAGLLGAGAGAVPSTPSLAGLLPTAPNPPAVPGAAAAGDTGSSAAWLQVNQSLIMKYLLHQKYFLIQKLCFDKNVFQHKHILQVASQLAVQDYLTRVQAAVRDPAQYAALQAQLPAGLIPGHELLSTKQTKKPEAGRGGKKAAGKKASDKSKGNPKNIFDHLKLPSDTEIVKSTGSSVQSKSKAVDSKSENSNVSIPNIPPGLTIERKKPGRKPLDPNYHVPSSGPMIDRVEITKIPVQTNGSSNHGAAAAPLDMSKARPAEEEGDAPLNLSMKAVADQEASSCEPPALTIKRKSSMDRESSAASTIPSDYYACEFLNIYLNLKCSTLFGV